MDFSKFEVCDKEKTNSLADLEKRSYKLDLKKTLGIRSYFLVLDPKIRNGFNNYTLRAHSGDFGNKSNALENEATLI